MRLIVHPQPQQSWLAVREMEEFAGKMKPDNYWLISKQGKLPAIKTSSFWFWRTPITAERVNHRVPDRGVSVMFGLLHRLGLFFLASDNSSSRTSIASKTRDRTEE